MAYDTTAAPRAPFEPTLVPIEGELPEIAICAPLEVAPTDDLTTRLFGVAVPIEMQRAQRACDAFDDLAMLAAMRRTAEGERWTFGALPEQRLLRKLDAIVASGTPALAHVISATLDRAVPDADMFFALVFVLGSLAHRDAAARCRAVVEIAPLDEEDVAIAIGDALALVPNEEASSWLQSELSGPRRLLAARVLGRRGALSADAHLGLARDEDVVATRLAAEVMDNLPHVDDLAVDALLASRDVETLLAAAASLLARADRRGLDLARWLAREGHARALVMVAVAGDADDATRLLEQAAETGSATAVEALGWAGAREAVPFLLGRLDDDKVAPAAALALHRITGLALEADGEQGIVSDDPPLTPSLDGARWRAALQGRPELGPRSRFGRRATAREALAEMLRDGTDLRAHRIAHLELTSRTGTAISRKPRFVAALQRELRDFPTVSCLDSGGFAARLH